MDLPSLCCWAGEAVWCTCSEVFAHLTGCNNERCLVEPQPEDLASRAAKASWLVCLPQPASIQSRGDGEVVLSPDVLSACTMTHVACPCAYRKASLSQPCASAACRVPHSYSLAVFQERVPDHSWEERALCNRWLHCHDRAWCLRVCVPAHMARECTPLNVLCPPDQARAGRHWVFRGAQCKGSSRRDRL